MFPRWLRSLRCFAISAIIIFLFGCMVAIIKVTKEADIGGPLALFQSNDEERRKANKESDNSDLLKGDLHRRGIPNIPKLKPLKNVRHDSKAQRLTLPIRDIDSIRQNLQNATYQKDRLKRKLERNPELVKKKKKKVVRLSFLRDDLINDEREWGEVPANPAVHAFYYPWYGNPDNDGGYRHWNHQYLPHWNKETAKKWPTGFHEPPDDIGSNFYPDLGCYSSKDDAVIVEHMRQMRFAGIGVLVISWYPPGQSDEQGKPSDKIVSRIMDIANNHGLKVSFHSEPYKTRTEATFADDVRYIIDTYSSHPAMYKHKSKSGTLLPVFYVYDSYLVNATHWAQLFRRGSSASLRGTQYDGIFLGLFVEKQHRSEILRAGFDGFYTYFASTGFTHGSTWTQWKPLQQFARQQDLLFVPSVGPGYVDTRVRPWNGMNTKWRENGGYYVNAFKAALSVKPVIISITSFNEWHEGTQIESAVSHRYGNFTYLDYTPNQPDYYLRLTRQHVESYRPLM